MKKSVFENEGFVEWGGNINEFLWICAGVNRKVLRQCPTDYAKYAGIGGTILFTALMATLSGSYALYSVFYNIYAAIAFGIFWGLLIFNLDRFIVNTMYSDGKSTISRMELLSGAPRIIMAIFLGIVIATPLELKIFEDAIDIRIEQDKEDFLKKRIAGTVHERDSIAQKRDDIFNGVTMFDTEISTSSIETNNLLAEIKSLQSQYAAIEAKISKIDNQITPLQRRLNTLDSEDSQRRGILEKIESLRSKRKEAVNDRNALAAEIRRKQGELVATDQNLKTLLANKQTETTSESRRLQGLVDSLNRVISEANSRHLDWSKEKIKENGSFRDKLDVEYKGFQAKMKAFDELKDESPSTYLSSLFVMLLFIIIETAPTFFKMMMEDGPYDFLLDAEKERLRDMAQDSVREFKEDIKTNIAISSNRNLERINAEKAANSRILDKISSIQLELLDEALRSWKSKELAKIGEDPSAYVSSTEKDPWK